MTGAQRDVQAAVSEAFLVSHVCIFFIHTPPSRPAPLCNSVPPTACVGEMPVCTWNNL